MAITRDAVSRKSASWVLGAAGNGWSHTVGSGTHRILFVAIPIFGSSVTVSGVTFNGVALTKVDNQLATLESTNQDCELWYLINPPAGTFTIDCTYSGVAAYSNGYAISYASEYGAIALGASAKTTSGSSTTNSPACTVNVTHAGAWLCGIGFSRGTISGGTQTDADGSGIGDSGGNVATGTQGLTFTASSAATWPGVVVAEFYDGSSSGPVITGPSGAAGAASITHTVNELQANAGTWSATGGSSWSLSGADAALLAIDSGGVVTKASGNFDRETKSSYSFNVLRDAVAQAVTLNIANVNEAPTFTGTLSVPTLTAGVAMTPVDFSSLFSDVDVGDSATYSKVGSWPSGVDISGTTIAGTPAAAGSSANLRVRCTDGGGLTADSNLFTITVSAAGTAPSITSHPSNQTVTEGATAAFSVSATGSGTLTYQWQRNGSNISGATSSSYTTPATTVSGGSANNGDLFRCVVTGDTSPAATSNAATLTVNAAGGISGAFTLPGAADRADKQEVTLHSVQALSALTVNGNGATVNGAPASLAANGFFRLRFDAQSVAWYRVG